MYKNVYGIWEVTTEGDVEGRTTINLGVYKGYVDEIAFHLADKSYYSLRFKYININKSLIPTNNKVDVSFDVDSGTWDISKETLIEYMKDFFKDRPNVYVKPCNGFASFTLTNNEDPVTIRKNKERERALNKLTEKEKKLLGLINGL